MSPPTLPHASVALVAERLFTGEAMLEGHALLVSGGRIEAIVPSAALPRGIARRELSGLLAPGFIDAQVNGGGGVLFNEAPSLAAIRTIGQAHRRFGTTGFLPTLISDTPEKLEAAIAAARQARKAGVPGALGIHLEGPFLAAARRGVHAAAMLRQPNESDLALLARADAGVVLVPASGSRPDTRLPATQKPGKASLAASPASPISSTRCRRSPAASPAPSARRWRIRSHGAASFSMASTCIRRASAWRSRRNPAASSSW